MHILLSSATSRAIFSHNMQLSRCSNFNLNSRKTFHRDGKLTERTVNTFPSVRIRRKACNRRWEEGFTRWQCQYCYSQSHISYILILSWQLIVKKRVFFIFDYYILLFSFTVHHFKITHRRDSIFWTICYNFSFNLKSYLISSTNYTSNLCFTFATFAIFFV